ncbi:MAG: 2-C-methyl-D-erythritol 4-phosphate cytidylyltransferase [Chthoniobacterales bacterium]|nr:2-C-methyl-D-erythritol 4-phosphate cytidylyltransferase [Chthoniobacterales bacterium]
MKTNLPKTAALIVAAGSSTRFGQDKLTTIVHQRPLISYSLKAFAQAPSIEAIILVVPPERLEQFAIIVASMKMPALRAKTRIVSGGSNRHQSVERGIAALPAEITFVAIHDGARPLITPVLIERTLQAAYKHGTAALACPVTDTLHRTDADGNAQETIDRNQLWAMQTPQVFRAVDLINNLTITGIAHETGFEKAPPTDEVSAFLQGGLRVHLLENREPNIKVTYPEDLALVAAYLARPEKLK